MSRRGLFVVVAILITACPAEPPPAPSVIGARGLPSLPESEALGVPSVGEDDPADEDAVRIEHDPEVLQVYRSTPMHLWVELPPEHPDARCRWSFGGGATPNDAPTACEIDHTFIGGTADERVTVVVSEGAWTTTINRIIPLERLPVSTRRIEPAPSGATPDKPSGPNTFRMALIADTAGAPGPRLAAIARRIVAIDADLAVHLGGQAEDALGWGLVREHLVEGLRAAEIPLLAGISPADLALGPEVRRPLIGDGQPLELADGEGFPERWALSFRGVYLVFISGAEQPPEALKWLRERLGEAQVYESRLVFSYLPLHPFGEHVPVGPEPHTLGPRFKVYELLLRARATALLSAGHEVYFKGRYGALPVVSVGSAGAGGKRLLGADVPQPASLVVVDIERGLPTRVFALADDGQEPLSVVLDEAFLPETVEVYTQ